PVEPFFKPDWSPEYLLSTDYACRLGVYRASLVRALDGFRGELAGAEDYDLVLRFAAHTGRIGHIADVLYHRRQIVTSDEAARRALQSHLAETGKPGAVLPGPAPGYHNVRFVVRDRPRISILIPSACRPVTVRGRNTFWIAHCAESIRRQSTYSPYEVLLIHNQDIPTALAP